MDNKEKNLPHRKASDPWDEAQAAKGLKRQITNRLGGLRAGRHGRSNPDPGDGPLTVPPPPASGCSVTGFLQSPPPLFISASEPHVHLSCFHPTFAICSPSLSLSLCSVWEVMVNFMLCATWALNPVYQKQHTRNDDRANGSVFSAAATSVVSIWNALTLKATVLMLVWLSCIDNMLAYASRRQRAAH